MSKEQKFLIPANESFVEEIVKISRACHLSLWSVEDYVAEINRSDSFNLVCFEENDQNVVGFMLARLIINLIPSTQIIENQELKSAKVKEEFSEAEILNIAVDPRHQKKGIGQIIFKQFLNFSIENKIKTVWLEVRESNVNAQSFYLKNNFQISHIRKNYYSKPFENALIMKLDVKLPSTETEN